MAPHGPPDGGSNIHIQKVFRSTGRGLIDDHRRCHIAPYADHKVHKNFDDIVLFSGYLQWEISVARYLPERCLCHFRYFHSIPRPIPVLTSKGIDIWFMSNIVKNAITIRYNVMEVNFPWQYLYGYLEWYFIISTMASFHMLSL